MHRLHRLMLEGFPSFAVAMVPVAPPPSLTWARKTGRKIRRGASLSSAAQLVGLWTTTSPSRSAGLSYALIPPLRGISRAYLR
jgi:hypothetical protein